MLAVSPNVAPAVTAGASDAPVIDDLAFSLVAALRRHPHLSNVLTHISRSNWPRIEHTLRVILDPATQPCDLTLLARNMIDLMANERGDTGRIFKPYFQYLLIALAGPNQAKVLLSRLCRLATSDITSGIAIPKAPAATAAAPIPA